MIRKGNMDGVGTLVFALKHQIKIWRHSIMNLLAVIAKEGTDDIK